MRYSKYILLFFMTIVSFIVHGQDLVFSEMPEDYQLYARDKTDSTEVRFSGKLSEGASVNSLTMKVFKNNASYDQQTVLIDKNNFLLTTKIDAGLHQFRFELYLRKNNRDSLYWVADSVVCGDAYIITGQSNSHPSSTLSKFSSPYCRSFGVKTGYEAYTEEDKKVRWGRATGNCPGLKKEVGGWFIKNPYGVGVWGMELSRLIMEKYQVPVCIINGGSGSSSIEQNMMYPEQPSLETSFGRLAYRVDQAGLKDNIKAIFWHQGETNTNTVEGYQNYAANFDTLQTDWKRVYKGLDKIYLFQLHPGCGRDAEGYYNELREIQNQLAKKYESVEIMSTTGVSGHDGCHFSYDGYLEFAERIFPLVSRDFYGEKTTAVITPPKLMSAAYQSETEIVLSFDQPVEIEAKRKVNGKTHHLKDQFFFKNEWNGAFVPVAIKGLKADGNQLILSLEKASIYKLLTYLPSKFYVGTKETYNGPWLTGSTNHLGALSFHQRPIAPPKTSENDPFKAVDYKVLDSIPNGIDFKIKLLIVDGFSNHDWQFTTQSIVKILDEYGGIEIDVSTSPDHLAPSDTLQKWNPDFSAYDVVLFNCNDLKKPVRWSDRVRSRLESFVAQGGGLYIFHSANNAFEDWEAYNKMIGLGWREKDFGKAIVIDDDEQMKLVEAGDGEDTSHGKRVDALVTRIGDHPIQQGLPLSWLFADIEIYTYARGPAENLTVLSYAKDEKYQLNFPIEWTVKYGKGNVYNSSLGHQWINQEEPTGLRCAAFQTEMVRAIQWLAGREIDQSVPEDFPGTETISLRDNIK